MQTSILKEEFYIAEWKIQPSLGRIIGPHITVRVTPKVMQVLCCLAAHPGAVVRRGDLMALVWEGTIVTDAVLSRAISELRKVFGDPATQPRFIETIPTIGYRLIAPVHRRPHEGIDAGDPVNGQAEVEAPPVPGPYTLRWIALGMFVLLLLGVAGTWSLRSERVLQNGPSLSVVPLTTTPGREYQPAFSPDGSRVVYVWNGDLYVRHIEGGEALQLTSHVAPESNPVWSPDGTAIVYVREDEGSCILYRIPSMGGISRRVTTCDPTTAVTLAWSPDGRTLVFPARPETGILGATHTSAALTGFDLQTNTRRVLTTPPKTIIGDRYPAFSPDGQQLAFVRRMNYWADDVYVLSLEDSLLNRISSDTRSVSGVDWTPDGQHLVWGSNRNGNYSLWMTGLNRQDQPRPVHITSSGVVNRPRLSRNGHRLVYENWSYESNIWRVPGRKATAEGGAKPVVASTMWDLQPALSPNGEHVAFISTRSGSFEVWVQDLEGQQARRLTQFEGPFVGIPRWSPDGQRLAFVARTGDGARDRVYLIDPDTPEARALTRPSYSSTMPSWNHDGTALYVGSNRSGSWQIWRHPLDGGEPRQVTQAGGVMSFESSDGAFLYYNKPGEAVIWEQPVGGGAETRLIDETTLAFDWWNWLATDEGFYFFQPRADDWTEIVFYNQTNGQVRSLATVEHLGFSPGIAIAPDESWIYYTRADRSEGDLMLVQHFLPAE